MPDNVILTKRHVSDWTEYEKEKLRARNPELLAIAKGFWKSDEGVDCLRKNWEK